MGSRGLGSAVPCGSGRGINGRARLAGMGIVQSYLQTTLALLFIVPRVTSVIFTCCDVRKEESNRNSGLKLVGFKPLEVLRGGAATPNGHPCVVDIISARNQLPLIKGFLTFELSLCADSLHLSFHMFLLSL